MLEFLRAFQWILIPLVFVVVMLVVVARRGFQVKLLAEDGLEATGFVVRKQTFSGRGGRTYRLRYRYVDQMGREHSHRSVVDDDVYKRYNEGDPFPIVYSRSKPHISAPKDVVDLVRNAMEAKKKKSASTPSPQ